MKKQVLNSTELETKTCYHKDGSHDTTPKTSTRGKKVTISGKPVYQPGREIIMPNGSIKFKPYGKGTGTHYKELWDVPYCTLKMCKTRLILSASVPLANKNAIWELESAVDCCLPTNTSKDVVEEIKAAQNSLRSYENEKQKTKTK